uniref:NADP-dependent oxidoreductase domain-containing protein n=1 Tax=Corethron hystrix TaxID=216773 RepID=A0A7S1BBJ7_9STRA|mmetsp:Transcript_20667/g.46872  ORF Transcript_20667/g.46872 Transcript_20667/m.46872 type:complete len:416 (+) Transcript_20667:55-1302(+)
MVSSKEVPRRPLPFDPSSATLPIIGLGCSSFSSFFMKDQDDGGTEITAEMLAADPSAVPRTWIDVIRKALDCGINVLDTAPWYGHGTSEITIGAAFLEVLATEDRDERVGEEGGGDAAFRRHRREHIRVHTKVGRYDADPRRMFDYSRNAVLSSVRRSIERMRCSYVDLLQLHDPEFAPSVDLLVDVTVPAMAECKKRGWARSLGITGYPLEVQHEILVRCAEVGLKFDAALAYCHFNWHDASLFSPSDAFGNKNRSFFESCAERDVAVLAAAPLSMGLFSPDGPPDWHPAAPELKEACRLARDICADEAVSVTELALTWALYESRIPCTFLGIADVEELEAAVAVARKVGEGKLDDILNGKERRALSRIMAKDGPFAKVSLEGKNAWDGVTIAEKFWMSIDGGREAADDRMRKG